MFLSLQLFFILISFTFSVPIQRGVSTELPGILSIGVSTTSPFIDWLDVYISELSTVLNVNLTIVKDDEGNDEIFNCISNITGACSCNCKEKISKTELYAGQKRTIMVNLKVDTSPCNGTCFNSINDIFPFLLSSKPSLPSFNNMTYEIASQTVPSYSYQLDVLITILILVAVFVCIVYSCWKAFNTMSQTPVYTKNMDGKVWTTSQPLFLTTKYFNDEDLKM